MYYPGLTSPIGVGAAAYGRLQCRTSLVHIAPSAAVEPQDHEGNGEGAELVLRAFWPRATSRRFGWQRLVRRARGTTRARERRTTTDWRGAARGNGETAEQHSPGRAPCTAHAPLQPQPQKHGFGGRHRSFHRAMVLHGPLRGSAPPREMLLPLQLLFSRSAVPASSSFSPSAPISCSSAAQQLSSARDLSMLRALRAKCGSPRARITLAAKLTR